MTSYLLFSIVLIVPSYLVTITIPVKTTHTSGVKVPGMGSNQDNSADVNNDPMPEFKTDVLALGNTIKALSLGLNMFINKSNHRNTSTNVNMSNYAPYPIISTIYTSQARATLRLLNSYTAYLIVIILLITLIGAIGIYLMSVVNASHNSYEMISYKTEMNKSLPMTHKREGSTGNKQDTL